MSDILLAFLGGLVGGVGGAILTQKALDAYWSQVHTACGESRAHCSCGVR